MTTQPLRVPRPRFAKYSWLILPVIAYAMLWWLSLSDSYVGVLIGPLTVHPTHNEVGAPIAPVCEYLRFGFNSFTRIEISEGAQNCSVLRIFSEQEGRLLEFGRSTNSWRAIE